MPEIPAMGLCDYGLESQPTDTPTEVNIGAAMHGGMFPASPVPRQQGVGRGPNLPGYETSESGTPLKGNLGERIEVW